LDKDNDDIDSDVDIQYDSDDDNNLDDGDDLMDAKEIEFSKERATFLKVWLTAINNKIKIFQNSE
jgi:hypothetical protein